MGKISDVVERMVVGTTVIRVFVIKDEGVFVEFMTETMYRKNSF